jgi:hypothetical protein
MNTLFASILSASSEENVTDLLRNAWINCEKFQPADCIPNFMKLRNDLNMIDPINVSDPLEWRNIQHARVLLNRLIEKQNP